MLAAVFALSLANPAVAIPPNATAVDSGVGWRCNTGYQRAGGGLKMSKTRNQKNPSRAVVQLQGRKAIVTR